MQKKVEKYLKECMRVAINRCQEHYIVSSLDGKFKIKTSLPFEKAVDPNKFPDYHAIILNPIDLASMKKRTSTDRYGSLGFANPLAGVLEDIDLMRTNAHTYNKGDENKEVRIMADALRNYFCFLLRVMVKLLARAVDVSSMSFLKNSDVVCFLQESIPNDVATFLNISSVKVDEILVKEGILSALPSTRIDALQAVREILNDELRGKIQIATAVVASSVVTNKLPVSLGKKKASTTSSTDSMTAPITVSLPKSKVKSFAAASFDELPSEPVAVSASTGKSKGLKRLLSVEDDDVIAATVKGSEKKKMRYIPLSVDEFDDIVPLPAVPSFLPVVKLPWKEAADSVLKALGKHAFVDVSKPTVAADFFHPVVELNPAMKESYERMIACPMDLGTLRERLGRDAILDAEEFYDLVIKVFRNAEEYNTPHIDSDYAMKLVAKCKLLVQYARHLCLEHLPLFDDSQEAKNPDQYGKLLVSQRTLARHDRERCVAEVAIGGEIVNSNPYTECKKLLKDLEKSRNKQEQEKIEAFLLPVDENLVPDYSVHVREAMDLTTIKFKLDRTDLPAKIAGLINRFAPQHKTYGEFLRDLRLIFDNAIVYNRAHFATDPTGFSHKICSAAEEFKELLDSKLIPQLTLSLFDRIEIRKLELLFKHKEEEEKRQKLQKEEEEKREIANKLMMEMIKNDPVLADDYNFEKKKLETQKQLEEYKMKQQLAVVATNTIIKTSSVQEELLLQEEHSSPERQGGGDTSPLSDTSDNHRKATAMVPAIPLIVGFGMAGFVPKRFQHLARHKQAVRNKAWDFFHVDSKSSIPSIAQKLHNNA